MNSKLLLTALGLPLLFGTAACGHDIHDRGVVVRVKSPDERSGYLGVSIQDMTHRLAKSMDVKTDEGALVNEVTEDSPADKAGIKEEDIIVEVDGKKIANADELREVVRKIKPDTKVDVVVMRKDEKKTLTATMGKAPRGYSYSVAPFVMPHIPRVPRGPLSIHIYRNFAVLGLDLSELNDQLGKYFGAPEGRGVLVNEVEEGSRAEKAGFQAGDVLIKIGKESVEDLRDVEDALKDYKEDDKADIEIIRRGTKKTLTMEIPDMDRRTRRGLGSHGNWLWDYYFEVNPPNDHLEQENEESFKNDLRKLELELRDLGKEIQIRAKRMQEELKARLGGVMS